MKKVSKFYLTRHRKPKDLIREMQMIDVEKERQKLRNIVSERKQKWKQAMVIPQLRHPDFNYTKKRYLEFSTLPCNASQEPFVTEKTKRQVITSNRAYSSTPNLKAGAFEQAPIVKTDVTDPRILNRMFVEFERIISQQSPGEKVRALKELEKNIHLPECVQKKNSQTCKKAYFQKFTTDRYNYYKTNDYRSIPDLLTSKCKTDRISSIEQRRSLESLKEQKLTQQSTKPKWTPQKSRLLRLAKLKRMNSSIDQNTHDTSQNLNLSILSGSRHSVTKENKESRRNSNYEQTKSRIMTERIKLSRMNSKNINSMEC